MQHKFTNQNSFRFEINARQIGDKLNNIEISNVFYVHSDLDWKKRHGSGMKEKRPFHKQIFAKPKKNKKNFAEEQDFCKL